MTTENTFSKRDPIEETYALILKNTASGSEASAPPPSKEILAEAWRDVLRGILEARVGLRLSEGMTDAQLAEFEQLVDTGQNDAASEWLDKNAPDHSHVVDDVLSAVIAEAAVWFSRRRLDARADGEGVR